LVGTGHLKAAPTSSGYALARRFDFPAALAAAFIVAGFALPADPAADRTARAGFLSFRCGIVRTEAGADRTGRVEPFPVR
jgi:hypothetical protein